MQLHLHPYRQPIRQYPLGELRRFEHAVHRRVQHLAPIGERVRPHLTHAPVVIGAIADDEFHLVLAGQMRNVGVKIAALFAGAAVLLFALAGAASLARSGRLP